MLESSLTKTSLYFGRNSIFCRLTELYQFRVILDYPTGQKICISISSYFILSFPLGVYWTAALSASFLFSFLQLCGLLILLAFHPSCNLYPVHFLSALKRDGSVNDVPLGLNLGGCAIPCLSETVLPLSGLLPFICRLFYFVNTTHSRSWQKFGRAASSVPCVWSTTAHFAFVISV